MQSNKSVPTSLSSFDELPDSAFVRLTTVKTLLGVSTATVWRLVKLEKLKAYKLTPRTTAFNVGELREKFLRRGE